MCTVCGCGEAHAGEPGHHHHGHEGDLRFGHHPAPGTDPARLIAVEAGILDRNDALAAQNRSRLAARGNLALNLVSSPGAGKTTLLVRTIEALAGHRVAVIEGDQETANDAERIRATGAPAVQINTGKGCHLDAHMVGHGLDRLDPAPGAVVFIENVGNLICPAAFDLGEDFRVAILSVPEGEDKPLKYPDIFTTARLALINKVDLAPHCDADLDLAEANLRRVNPDIEVIRLSARTGAGMGRWLDWLEAALADKARQAAGAEV